MTAKNKEGSQPRVIHRKVKSGITCRTRRVKCDESRPACMRCLKYGTECGGYQPGRRRPPSSAYGSFATQARALVPKNYGGPMMIQPTSSLFESEIDLRYFRLFSDRIAGEICPYFKPDEWSKMILQACMHEASIRHAAVAIGALGKMYEMAQMGKCAVSGETIMLEFERLPAPGTTRESRTRQGVLTDDSANESYMHHRHALEQYDKAIKRMRNDIASGNQSMRTTLIICIIIICFEAIHGNHESAAGQLQSGLHLIQDWVAQQNRSLQHHPQGFSSPAPEVIEDFLVQSFGRMEIQSMSVFDPRPVSIHDSLKHEGLETIKCMPAQFSTIEQARIYLDLITRRLMHFTSSVHVPRISGSTLEKPKAPPAPSTRGQATSWNEVISPMPWCDGKIPMANTSSTLSSQPLINEQASLYNELKAWTKGFDPLLKYTQTTGGQDSISALTLLISSIASTISLRSAFFINESAHDQFLPEFKRIVSLASILLQIQSKSRGRSSSPPTSSSPTSSSSPSSSSSTMEGREPLIHFAFDIGIIPPLYLVIVKCRDHSTRHQALKLMDENPRREGVWDSVATSALGKWVIGLEEDGARKFNKASFPTGNGGGDGEWEEVDEEEELIIPEEMRVRKAAMRFDLLERRANMGCLQMDVEKRIFVQKKEVFKW